MYFSFDFSWQGSTIGIHLYACMPNFIGVHMILDMHRMTCSFFPYDFLSFQHFSGSDNFILFKTLLLYVCPLFVLGRDFFKENIFFNF